MQCAIWADKWRELGHEVIISAFYGLAGAPANWNGIQILPGNYPGDRYGTTLLAEQVKRHKIDVVITLSDIWVLEPANLLSLPVAHWMPVDCVPLSTADKQCLDASGAIPIAMSRFGERQLRDAGFDPLYVPHGIDLSIWKPPENRDAIRAQLGLTGLFAIGINAANKDAFRKGMFEQLAAFSMFHAKHPDSVLLVHGLMSEPGSLNLAVMAERLGIAGAIRWVEQYDYLTGQVPVQHLVNWYGALDLYTACSFGEGFGLTVAEAQACGCPAVVTDCSALTEVAGAPVPRKERFWEAALRRIVPWWPWPDSSSIPAGWKVGGEPFWNPVHNACWVKPSIRGILKSYEQAYRRDSAYEAKRAAAPASAARYDADVVLRDFWDPALKELAVRVGAA